MNRALPAMVGMLLLAVLVPAVQASGSSGPSHTLLWQKYFGFPEGTKDNWRDWSTSAVVDGVLYIGASVCVNGFPYYPDPSPNYIRDWWSDLYAFNASNGNLLWEVRVEKSAVLTSCVAAEGIAYYAVGSYEKASVLALNVSTGALLWNYTANNILSSLTTTNGIVYTTIGDYNGTLHAFNATNGNTIWDAPGTGRTALKIVNGILYTGSSLDYNLYALNASSGQRLWNFSTGWWIGAPDVAGGLAYFAADKNVYALNATTGTKLWNYSTGAATSLIAFQEESSAAAFAKGIVYIYSTREQNLLALKAFNGVKLWNYSRAVGNPPTIAKGVVYVDIEYSLCALNAYNGSKIWESSLPAEYQNRIPAKVPSVDDGALYFGYDTALYAVELQSLPTAISPPNIVPALTDEGKQVNLTVSGSLSSSQISNVYITSSNATSAIYLDVSGSGIDAGFSNMTIPKSLVRGGTAPTVYVGDVKVKNQSFSQDINNYYVWYATGSGLHEVSVVFSPSPEPSLPSPSPTSSPDVFPSPSIPEFPVLTVLPFAAMVTLLAALLAKGKAGSINKFIGLGLTRYPGHHSPKCVLESQTSTFSLVN